MTPFLPQEIIRKKREGETLSAGEIGRFVAGITSDSITDAQIAAFAMATFFRSMTPQEGAALTLAMRDSGTVIDWQDYGFEPGAPITDKHSTGGVGDKVSLMLAPIVAACGGLVPMISGRGLGHSGGTLDKLESVAGYDPFPSAPTFVEIVRNVGCSVIGQTSDLAPADRRFYAVRDVTATVESVPLITASILSKKLAAGLGSLVMDVKCGNGAFMATPAEAERLATMIVQVAEAAGTPTRALITDMDWVLGHSAGNAVEVRETVNFLTNPAAADVRLSKLTLELAAHMLVLSALADDIQAARGQAEAALTSGAAAERFARMIKAQGGPADLLERAEAHLPLAPVVRPVASPAAGFVADMNTRAVGVAVVALGGGRTTPGARIDHRVGFDRLVQRGDAVAVGDPLAVIYASDEDAADAASASLLAAIEISEERPTSRPVVQEIITG